MRKKILLVTGGLQSGGAERFSAFLSNNLPSHQFEKVLVVCSLEDCNYSINPEVKVIDLNVPLKTSFYRIFKVIRKENPDIVFSTLTAVNVIVSVVRLFLPKRTVYILRESSILSEMVQYFSRPPMIIWLIKKLYPRFNMIVAQSKAMKQDMIEHFGISGEKIVQIYNPIAAQPLKLTSTSPVFQLITVGNVRKEKGHDRLVRALSHLKIDFHYTIVGAGVEAEIIKVKALIEKLGLQEKITFTGAQKNPFTFLQNSDLFIQGSYFEGFPNCLLEANSVGLPIVAFDCPGGTKEIMDEGVNGFLIPNNDEVLFAKAIEKAMSYSFDSVVIRENILKKFNQEVTLQKYVDLFESFSPKD